MTLTQALTLNAQGKTREAVAILEKLDGIHAKRNLGVGYCNLGRFDDAERVFREIIRDNPDEWYAWCALAHCHRRDRDEALELARYIREALSRTQDKMGRQYLYFALGKLYDEAGEYDLAWEHITLGSELADKTFDFERYERYAEELDKYLTPSFAQDLANINPGAGENCIFVVGMPRSGTTLVERILTSHPDIKSVGEYVIIPHLNQRLNEAAGLPRHTLSCTTPLRCRPEDVKAAADGYLQAITDRVGEARYIVNKVPQNFIFLPLIQAMLPAAKIIHCYRDYRDVALSCYFQNFDNGCQWSFSLEGIARFLRLWRMLLGRPLAIKGHLVEYEVVVLATPFGGPRAMFDFLGLEWDGILRNDGVINSASQWQARQPIYKSSIGRWKNYEKQLQPLIEALG